MANKYNEPVVEEDGVLHSWTGEDKLGKFEASAFVPNNHAGMCHLKGQYLDVRKSIDKQFPLAFIEGMWKLRNFCSGW